MKRYSNSKLLKQDIKSGEIKDGEMILIDKRKMYSGRIEIIRAILGIILITAGLLKW